MSEQDPAVMEQHHKYWTSNLKILALLLTIWAVASYGCGIIFKENLDQFSIGGAPFGFWMAQQGAIIIFVLLLIAYAILMNNLDKKFGFDEGDE